MSTPKSISPWLDTVPDARRFPPLTGWVTTDATVIGGGIAGVMTAWNLAANGLSVALVEKNHVATGDTGLTTAFLTRVPDASAADLLRVHGPAWLSSLFAATTEAQRWFRTLVAHESIACDFADCASYNCAYDPAAAGLQAEWAAVRYADPLATYVAGSEAARCEVPSVTAAIRFEQEARFHVRKLIFGLLARPAARRIQTFEETEVDAVQLGDAIVVRAGRGAILCRSVVCVTGRPHDAFGELSDLVKPVLTFALAARYDGRLPMSDSLFWDTDEPYQYFRRLDERTIILGGGDRPAEAAGMGAAHASLRAFLDARLPGAREITHQWSGTLFETADGLPYIAEHPHHRGRVFVATGFGGNGMVVGMLAGRILADLVSGEANAHASLFGFSRTGVEIPAPASAGATKTVAAPAFVAVASPADLVAGQGRVVSVNGRSVALFRIGEAIFAIDNACTHAGGPLARGPLEGTVVTCPWHGSKFDVTTGEVRGGPASRPQRCYRVRVTNGRVEVEI